jgi:N-carbamoylputrescine amidase
MPADACGLPLNDTSQIQEIAMVRIGLVQQAAGEDRADNVGRGLQAVRRAAEQGAQLVAFAEVAFSPFFPQCPAEGPPPLHLAEAVPGPITEAFAALARELGVVIVLNLYEREGQRAFDSSPVIDADGSLLGVTRMLHIAEMPGFHEQGYYWPGDKGMPVYETAVGRVGVAICYDRHYPEVMRSLGLSGAELVVVPQAGSIGEWPEGLYQAELRVASFQNGYFTALCNRVGQDGQLQFAGESFVCDPEGQVVAAAAALQEELLLADIDLTACQRSTARRLFLRDRRTDWLAP